MARLAAGLPPSGDMLTLSWRVSGRLSLLSCTLSLCCPALLPWRRPLQEALLRAGRRLPESYGGLQLSTEADACLRQLFSLQCIYHVGHLQWCHCRSQAPATGFKRSSRRAMMSLRELLGSAAISATTMTNKMVVL